jgi:alpha-L-fucosidase 2
MPLYIRPRHMPESRDRYNVVWDTPSADASGSMPLGNGDVGVNVWVEPSGDVLLLIGKTDAWDENSINLKLGRVRLRVLPAPAIVPFRQSLLLRTGEIEITLGAVRLRIWVDANHPVIRVEATSNTPLNLSAALEVWRTEPRATKTQTGDLFKNLDGPDPFPTVVSPDRIMTSGDAVVWLHHNERREHDGYEINMRLQGLVGFLDQVPHPLLGRTFGGAMKGDGFRETNSNTLVSHASVAQRLNIYALTLHSTTPKHWLRSIREMIEADERLDHVAARREHERWWAAFWGRSWIDVTSDDAGEAEAALQVSRGYVLQRFTNACGGRGAQPIKFNGSIFTVGKPDDPDFRRWGGPGFWFMNQRLIYWPMLAAGDLDLLRPWLAMYRDQLPIQRHRTRTYYGHGGAHFPETSTFWGAEVSAHYGWTPFEHRPRPEAECAYVTYYWSGGIELTLILATVYAHTLDADFAREFLIPIADAVTEFYDLHYVRGERGKIRFEPAQALETWHEATNPLPEIAGLRYTLDKLLELPAELTSASLRHRWCRMLGELPDLPIGQRDGKPIVLPAERFDRKKNTENPELYCVFPYRLFGVGKPDLQLARDTFDARLHREHACWSQDDVQMALLGLTEQAKANVTRRASDECHSQSRFPAFWDAHHDWVPDMDHGGVLQLALQSMLMQCDGRRIVLLPAWPREWDADFKLHAPLTTIVEGTVRGGRIVDLRVTPESRRQDVVVWPDREHV